MPVSSRLFVSLGPLNVSSLPFCVLSHFITWKVTPTRVRNMSSQVTNRCGGESERMAELHEKDVYESKRDWHRACRIFNLKELCGRYFGGISL